MPESQFLGLNEILEVLDAAKYITTVVAIALDRGSIKTSDIKHIITLSRSLDVFKDPATNSDRIIPSRDQLTKEEKDLITLKVLELVGSVGQTK